MKRYFLIIAAAAALTGCFGDPAEETPHGRGQTSMTIDFEVPEAPEMQVATRSAADDAAREGNIVRLDIFVFDENGDLVAGDEGHKTMTGGITTVNGRGRAQIYVTIPPVPGYVWRQFCMVANGSDALLAGIVTKSDLESAVVSGVSSMPFEEFVMSGSTALNKIDTASPTVNMSLRRMVSRVDVLLADAVSNFEITRVRLINARDGGYVFERLDAQNNVDVPAGSSLTDYGFVPASEASHRREFTSQLYCHENYDAAKDDAATTAVIIGGMYKGQEVFYRVNLHDNASQAQLRRNYVYKVRILSVNGPGNADPAAAILDAPQNIDYEIVDWDYSLHCDVVYDGKHYLGLSRSEFTFGKAASDGTAAVVTNLDAGDVAVSECDADGEPAAWTWLEGTLTGSKLTVTVEQNDETAPRAGYLLVQSLSKPRLKLIVKVQQYHSDVMLMAVSPSVIMAPTAASNDKTSELTFTFPAQTEWMIESVRILEDTGRTWFRIQAPYDVSGTWIPASGTPVVTLGYDVDAMNPEFMVRTAVVTLRARYGAIEEKKTITVSQTNATEELTLSRYYIGKTAAPAVEKIYVMSYAGWTAWFATATEESDDLVFTKTDPDWVCFADSEYSPLPGTEKYEIANNGSGDIHLVFDQVPVDKNAYIIVESGSQREAIRLKRFTQQVDKINGYETMELPGHYQWGRRPDGHETSVFWTTTSDYVQRIYNATVAANYVKRQPRFGDPAYGKPVVPIMYTVTVEAKNADWLNVDNSLTPSSQRSKEARWDAAGKVSDVLSETNLTGRKTEFDPCPDGWRVPTAREMENIFVYGPNRPGATATKDQNAARYIRDDGGREVKLAMNMSPNATTSAQAIETSIVEGRFYPGNASIFYRDYLGYLSNYARKFYWTSTMSASGGPYAFRMMHNDHPEVFWTIARPELGTNVRWPDGGLENAASMMTQVRCVRDNQTDEALDVNRRRLTVDYEAQSVEVELTASNIVGSWTAVSSEPAWLTLDGQTTGTGDATLTLRVTQNNGNNREGYIRITSSLGTVANIVVRQTDVTGVCIGGQWWMDRNLGATRGDHHVAQVYDSSTIGYAYRWGTTNGYTIPNLEGSGLPLQDYHAWNVNSREDTRIAFAKINYPYAVKNETNDPCPDGWRIPASFEWTPVGISLTAGGASTAYTAPYHVGTLDYNKFIIADNGRRVDFPISPAYRNTTSYYPSMYISSTILSATYVYGFVWTNSSDQGIVCNQSTNSIYNMLNYLYVVRCVQDVPDDWDEYTRITKP